MNTRRPIFSLSHLWPALAVTVVAALSLVFETKTVIEAEAAYLGTGAADAATATEVENRFPDPTPAADVTHFSGQVTLAQFERAATSSSLRIVIVNRAFGRASDDRTSCSDQLSQRSAQVLFCTWVV